MKHRFLHLHTLSLFFTLFAFLCSCANVTHTDEEISGINATTSSAAVVSTATPSSDIDSASVNSNHTDADSICSKTTDSDNTDYANRDFANTVSTNPYSSMVMVNDTLYFHTGRTHNVLRCGLMDGQITSTVPATMTPSVNDQSNFGTGYGYQYGTHGTIDIKLDDNWYVFQEMIKTDVSHIKLTNHITKETKELSRTLFPEDFWRVLARYDALETVQSENQTTDPHPSYSLQLYDESGNLLHTILPRGQFVEIDGIRYEDYSQNTTTDFFLTVDALWEEDLPKAAYLASDLQEVDSIDDFLITATYVTPKGVSLLFTNDTNLTISYGDSYILQVYCNEQWQEVDYIIDNWGFAMAYELPPHSTRSGCIKWSGFHGILSPGTYRIVKQIRAYNEAGSYTEHQIATNFVVES